MQTVRQWSVIVMEWRSSWTQRKTEDLEGSAMRWHKGFKLRMVEPRGHVQELELPKLAAPAPRPAPTAHEVFSALRGMRGAEAAIRRVPALEYHIKWSD